MLLFLNHPYCPPWTEQLLMEDPTTFSPSVFFSSTQFFENWLTILKITTIFKNAPKHTSVKIKYYVNQCYNVHIVLLITQQKFVLHSKPFVHKVLKGKNLTQFINLSSKIIYIPKPESIDCYFIIFCGFLLNPVPSPLLSFYAKTRSTHQLLLEFMRNGY